MGGLGFQFLWDLIFLCKFSYRNKFIQKIQVASINFQSKIKINGLLSESFTFIQVFQQVCPLSILLCIIVTEVPVDGDTRIKGIQMEDHETKILKFADDTTIFLRDFSCFTKTELILELSKEFSSTKIFFSKNQTYGVWHIKLVLINEDKWPGHNSPSKWLEYIFCPRLKKLGKNIWQFNKKISYSGLFELKITINQILWSTPWYIGQVYTIPKRISKKIEKRVNK